ncbi:hypothetical protein A3860_21025 [Niastella vici]|uniref:Ig-like domain-containing protein n=1 Tax=Niastella vici TaxID=1703345 RepID=A0A1V9G1L6_9BACT|nr:hypothetical protein A3860_21025 [Niastella vici]
MYATVAFSQPVAINKKNNTLPVESLGRVLRTTATEICNNLVDDDNNKLVDDKDFACYFNGLTRSTCKKSSIIWAIDGGGNLYWFDMSTGAQNFVGSNQFVSSDITWASNGKLYGTGGFPNGIWEIDPYSGSATFINKLPDNYNAGVAMTADASGNLYITASLNGQVNVVKLNIATWELCVIADLSAHFIFPAGDLTFLDGMLYMSGSQNRVAKINVKTGDVYVQPFINNTPTGYYGMVNIGDGFLYVAQNKNIYQVNPVTMEVSNTPAFKLSSTWEIYGLAGYYELCQAPQCTGKTNITPSENPPYCSNQNIKLKAAFYPGCSSGTPSISWSWYTGGAIFNGDELEINTPGKYYLNYRTPTETCDRIDSFTLQYAANAPLRASGEYQSPTGCSCTGTMRVSVGCGSGNFKYEWSTGATTPMVSNVCPGTYSVKVTDIIQAKDTTINFIIPSPPNSIQDAQIITTGDHCNQTDGNITISQVQGGTAPYQYALNNQSFGNNSIFPALPKGNYTITIRDNTGCLLQKQAIVQAKPGPEKIWYTQKDAYCGLPGGTINIDSVKNGSSPYTYSLGGAPFGQQTGFTNITPGPNTISVKDNYGCLLQEPLTIYQSDALQIAISPKDTTICASQKITFNATLLSNNEGVQFAWDGSQPSPSAKFNTAVYANKFMVVQAIDKNGCTTADSAFITAPYCDSLFAKCVIFPSAFTPDQNGLNDTFGPHLGSCEIQRFKMVIYNRWGQLIFQSGKPQERWNGTVNGNAQPSGVYVYNCVWEDPMGYVHRHKGVVMLIR